MAKFILVFKYVTIPGALTVDLITLFDPYYLGLDCGDLSRVFGPPITEGDILNSLSIVSRVNSFDSVIFERSVSVGVEVWKEFGIKLGESVPQGKHLPAGKASLRKTVQQQYHSQFMSPTLPPLPPGPLPTHPDHPCGFV